MNQMKKENLMVSNFRIYGYAIINSYSYYLETLPDMKVVAETKFLFRGDKSALVYNWEGYGLKLHVPAGSSASFRAQIVDSVKFELPEGTEPVSPFYCVTSKGELTGPVGVEIQHFADSECADCSGLSFAVYRVEKEKPAVFLFKEYSAQFSYTSSYGLGRIEVNFSKLIFRIVRKITSRFAPVFRVQLFYCILQMEADIVIAPNIDLSQVRIMNHSHNNNNYTVDKSHVSVSYACSINGLRKLLTDAYTSIL